MRTKIAKLFGRLIETRTGTGRRTGAEIADQTPAPPAGGFLPLPYSYPELERDRQGLMARERQSLLAILLLLGHGGR